MLDNMTFSRHDLLLPDRDSVIKSNPDDVQTIRDWLHCGYPVIVRRPCLTDGELHCGIPLPPEQGKKRISFTVDPVCVKQRLALPLLSECLPLLPEARREKLTLLSELRPEVFGSLAWQYLTGMPYLHENSDVDLLFRVGSQTELRELVGELSKIDSAGNCDIEIMLWHGRAFSWRELRQDAATVLMKADYEVFLCDKKFLSDAVPDAKRIAWEAEAALYEELETYPKPGLVSYADSGSHTDMDAGHFRAGIGALREYFETIADAGRRGAPMAELRQLGLSAEERMLVATDGINTHRGAIFSVGMLAAAAGYKAGSGDHASLGEIVTTLWGKDIMRHNNPGSNGDQAVRRYGGGGAKTEVVNGFPLIYNYGLPAFKAALDGRRRNAARLECFYAMLEYANDTTLLHRGGRDGHDFAVGAAVAFNRASGEEKAELARHNHREFVRRGLSCGGVADLLAATIFIHRMEELWQEL